MAAWVMAARRVAVAAAAVRPSSIWARVAARMSPPNGGGVNLPGGYGPTYRGVWQGPVVPTQGGGAGVGK